MDAPSSDVEQLDESESARIEAAETNTPEADQFDATASGSSANGEASAAEQVATLNAELLERDDLIAALTDQLEEAANRLDRMHRQGADRAPIGGTAGFASAAADTPAGFSEQIARLTNVVGEWQAEDHFGEIIRRLDVIQESITQIPSAPRRGLSDSSMFEMEPWTPPSAERESDNAAWEDMKAELLRQEEGSPADEPIPELVSEQPETTETTDDDDLLVEVPHPVDLDDADMDQLRAAVEERDEFISRLIRRLRATPQGRFGPIDWEQLAEAPEDLRERLEELEARLQELLRLEECELSLERARLARDRAELEQLRHAAGRNGRTDHQDKHESLESERESRWLRVFGFGKKADEDGARFE